MTRRTSAAQLELALDVDVPPPAPASGTRAVERPRHPLLLALPCPGLLADHRTELVSRRAADCKHLDAAELAWIEEHAGAQARCPRTCSGFDPVEERALVQLGATGRSSAMPVSAKAGRVRSPQSYEREGVRLCSRCRKRTAREPQQRWTKKPRWRWCEPCTREQEART